MACAVLLLAQTVYVTVGFGSGLLALGCLALLQLDVTDVVVTLMFTSLPAELAVVWRSWRQLDWAAVFRVCVGVAIGTAIGTVLLATQPPEYLVQLLGTLLLLCGFAFLLIARTSVALVWPSWTQLPIGLSSGMLSGLLGAGGPPLVIYYRLAGASKDTFRGSLMAIFLAATLVRVAASGASGLVTVTRVTSAGCLLPAAALGIVLGKALHSKLSEAGFRAAISVGLAALGLGLLLR